MLIFSGKIVFFDRKRLSFRQVTWSKTIFATFAELDRTRSGDFLFWGNFEFVTKEMFFKKN